MRRQNPTAPARGAAWRMPRSPNHATTLEASSSRVLGKASCRLGRGSSSQPGRRWRPCSSRKTAGTRTAPPRWPPACPRPTSRRRGARSARPARRGCATATVSAMRRLPLAQLAPRPQPRMPMPARERSRRPAPPRSRAFSSRPTNSPAIPSASSTGAKLSSGISRIMSGCASSAVVAIGLLAVVEQHPAVDRATAPSLRSRPSHNGWREATVGITAKL